MKSNTAHKVSGRTTQEAVEWITSYLSRRLDIAPASIGLDVPFTEYGVDSIFAVIMSVDLADWTGHDLPPNLLYEYPTIKGLAGYIASLS